VGGESRRAGIPTPILTFPHQGGRNLVHRPLCGFRDDACEGGKTRSGRMPLLQGGESYGRSQSPFLTARSWTPGFFPRRPAPSRGFARQVVYMPFQILKFLSRSNIPECFLESAGRERRGGA